MWFLVAVVLLIVWLSERSSLKKKAEESYAKGWWDGYAYVKNKIASLNVVDKATIEKVYEGVEGKADSVADEVVYNDADDPGALFRGQDEATATSWQPETVQYELDDGESAQPALSDTDIADERERRTLQNLNILLYVGSFLIVAAMAVFVTLVMPASVKLLCLIGVTICFYVSGLVLHARSERLRPAALAFVGTGLAVLPFLGFALTSLGNISGTTAWLVTSLAGLVAYGFAAVRLQSQLVAYITMAYVASLSLASISSLQLSLLWYYIALIGVALVCMSIHYLFPKLLPQIFWQPIEQTGMLLTPLTLVVSIAAAPLADLFMYVVLCGVATLYYIVAWLESRNTIYELAARALAHATVLLWGYDLYVNNGSSQTFFATVWIGCAGLQLLYSLVRVRRQVQASVSIEQVGMGVSIALMVLGMQFLLGVPHQNEWISAALTLVGISTVAVAMRLRQVGWLYGTLFVSCVLPFLVGRAVIDPPIGYGVIAGVFILAGAAGLAVLERQRAGGASANRLMLLTTAILAYAMLTTLSGILSGDSLTMAWTLLLAAGTLVALSYLTDSIAVELLGLVGLVWSISVFVDWIRVPMDWRLVTSVLAATAVLFATAAGHHVYRQIERRNSVIILGVIVFAAIAFVVSGGYIPAMRTALILLLAGAVAAFGVRAALLQRAGQVVLGTTTLIAYAGYGLLAMMIAIMLGFGWIALVGVLLTVLVWASSYIERQSGVLLFGNMLLIIGLYALWQWLGLNSQWMPYGIAWIATALYYLFYWYSVSSKDDERNMISFVSVLVALGTVAVINLVGETQWVGASAGSLLALAAVVGIHGYIRKSYDYIEAAAYIATASLQRLAALAMPDLSLPLYAHWWAAVIMLVAVVRRQYHYRSIVALTLVTGSTGIYALMDEPGYSLLFLIEHIIVAIIGATLRKQWAMWWGIIATVIAIVYFLRNFTALVLLFLGFLLILFVVWRLLKVGKK